MNSEINSDLVRQFVGYLKAESTSELTIKNYRADIYQFVKWYENLYQSPFSPESVGPLQIKIYRDEMSARKLSDRTAERHISSLRKLFSYLKTSGYNIQKGLFESKPKADNDQWNLKGFKQYLYENKSSHLTIKNYIMDVRQFLSWSTLEKGRQEADALLVEEYKAKLLQSGFSALSINRKLSSIRRYIAFANRSSVSIPNIPKAQVFDRESFLNLHKNDIQILNNPHPTNYSRIPPLRLIQKSTGGILFVFDRAIALPISKLLNFIFETAWQASGKSMFVSAPGSKIPTAKFENIKKEAYVPSLVSTQNFPINKRLLFYISHNRPKWYERYHSYSFVHYLHFALLFLFCIADAVFVYNKLAPQRSEFVLGTAAPLESRTILFKAKLANNDNNPILVPSDLRVAIYDDPKASGSALLWEDVLYHVVPDSNGYFTISLGNDKSLPQNIFTNSYGTYLGVTIGNSQELTPRQQLANVAQASDSKALSGLLPITSTQSTSNVVLALNSSGNLIIGGNANPVFQATGGEFKLSGQPLTLATNLGSNSDVTISPDGNGMLDIQKPIHNSTNNNNALTAIGAVEVDDLLSVLATSDAQSAFTVNQNGTGRLISGYNGSTAKFSIDSSGNAYFAGNLGIGTENPLQSIDVKGNVMLSGIAPTLYLGPKNYIGFDTINTTIYSASGDITVHPATASSFRPFTDNMYSLGNTTFRWNTLAVGTGTSSFDGKVGIGTQSPSSQLSVLANSDASTAATRITNLNTNDQPGNVVLSLALGSSSNSQNSRFVEFILGATSNTDGTGVGRIRSNGSIAGGAVAYESGAADFAEYFDKGEDNLSPGDIVELNSNKKAVKATNSNAIYGVVSSTGAFIGNLPKEGREQNSVIIGLLGQLPVRVSTESGKIEPNDLITLSSTPGVGMKAKGPGKIIGRAMQSLESGTQNILVLVDPSWSDPDVYLTSTGDLNIVKNLAVSNDEPTFSLQNTFGDLINRIGAFSKVIAANLQAGKIISPIAEVDVVHTNLISPIEPGSQISVSLNNSKLSIFNSQLSTSSAVASIDNAGNATFSGTLNSKELNTTEASISGTLHAGTIIADSIIGLVQASTASSNLQPLASGSALLNSLTADTGQFNLGLIALGPSGFTDVSVANQLAIGASFVISDNSISALGQTLNIQPFASGNISFESGKIAMDTDGNLTVNGKAVFAKDISVQGSLFAKLISPLPGQDLFINLSSSENQSSNLQITNSSGSAVFVFDQSGNLNASGSGTFNKLNLSLVSPAFATSNVDAIATGSAGTAAILPHQIELTIKDSLVTANSLIYITPIGTPSGQTPFLIRQADHDSFTVGIEQPAFTDTNFNWLIIN